MTAYTHLLFKFQFMFSALAEIFVTYEVAKRATFNKHTVSLRAGLLREDGGVKGQNENPGIKLLDAIHLLTNK